MIARKEARKELCKDCFWLRILQNILEVNSQNDINNLSWLAGGIPDSSDLYKVSAKELVQRWQNSGVDKKEDGYHRPVLLQSSIDNLNIQPNGVYVDVTFGGGGHSREILKQLDKGRLIAFDQDPEAQANRIDDPRFELVDQNFQFMKMS